MNIHHRQRGHIPLFDQRGGHDSKSGGYTRGHIHIHADIHSIDPSFCHMAVAYEAGHNAIKT